MADLTDLARHDSPLRSRTADDSPKLDNDLHEAVLAGGPTLHWQLIVHCPTRRLHGFEAIARWNKHSISLVSPAILVPIARMIGQHRKLALWVLRHALVEAARWPGHMRAAVDRSALCFQCRGLSRAALTVGAAESLQ